MTDDASAEMRGAGISSAGIEGDLGGIEDESLDSEDPIQGSEGDGPETTTSQDLGGMAAPKEQTI
jgi:hypothetical protein